MRRWKCRGMLERSRLYGRFCLWRWWRVWPAAARAGTLWQEPLSFSHVWDVGLDSALFVVGAAEEIGAWNPANAVRLTWTSGNIWTGNVALPAGRTHEYKFIRRSMASASLYCNSSNADVDGRRQPGRDHRRRRRRRPMPARPSTTIPPGATFGSGTAAGARNGWMRPWRISAPDAGPANGCTPSPVIGTNDQTIEFVFNGVSNGVSAVGQRALSKGPARRRLELPHAAGRLLGAGPAGFQLSAPGQRRRPAHRGAGGEFHGGRHSGRTIRIYLPRGYDQNTARRYPVLYMHDGQELFCGDTPRADQWNADWHCHARNQPGAHARMHHRGHGQHGPTASRNTSRPATPITPAIPRASATST